MIHNNWALSELVWAQWVEKEGKKNESRSYKVELEVPLT